MFWKRHQKTSLETAKELLAQSHAAVMKLIKKYSDQELFTKGYFLWTGNAALGSFFCKQHFKPLRLGNQKAKGPQKKLRGLTA